MPSLLLPQTERRKKDRTTRLSWVVRCLRIRGETEGKKGEREEGRKKEKRERERKKERK